MFSGAFCFWHLAPERSWLSNKYSVTISYGSHLYTHGELSLLIIVRRSKTKSRTWPLHVPKTTKQEHVNLVRLFSDKGSQLEVGLLGERNQQLGCVSHSCEKINLLHTGDDWKHLLLSISGWLGTVHSKTVFRQLLSQALLLLRRLAEEGSDVQDVLLCFIVREMNLWRSQEGTLSYAFREYSTCSFIVWCRSP